MSIDRIRHAGLREKVMSADKAAQFIQNGMMLAITGFTGQATQKPYQLPSLIKPRTLMAKVKNLVLVW